MTNDERQKTAEGWQTTALAEVLKEFPAPVRAALREAYAALPAGQQAQIRSVAASLPRGDLTSLKSLLAMVADHYRPLLAPKRSVVIVGPVNTGKSSLYNTLIASDQDQAGVSPVPGTTRVNQTADAGLFNVVDTPGADAYGPVGQAEKDRALAAARSADLLVILFDATQGISASDRALYDELAAIGKPYIVALNKADLIPKKELAAVESKAAENLGLGREAILSISATEKRNLDRLLQAVIKAEPGLLMAVGAALPAYRASLAWPRILSAAVTAGAIALAPIPVASFVPLITLQSGLVLSLAGLYGYKLTPARARELVATFGAGFGARMLFQQLVEIVPVAGWVLSSAVAASVTAGIGYAAMLWFDRGEKVSAEAMHTLVEEWTIHLASALKTLGEQKPGRAALRAALDKALKGLNPRLP